MLSKSLITSAYCKVLGRKPAESAINMWERSGADVEELIGFLYSSEEYALSQKMKREEGRHILMFGAYGNGNLGDAIQPMALSKAIKRADPSTICWAGSVLSDSDFAFDKDKKISASACINHAILNRFSAIIIGGGGLFAHPHLPLDDDGWVDGITVPILIIGIGASISFAPQTKRLIKRAFIVSGRDCESIETMAKMRTDVFYMPDPLVGLAGFDMSVDAARSHSTCWILRGPLEAKHHEMKAFVLEGDEVCLLEPLIDRSLKQVFPRALDIFSIEELLAVFGRHSRVISMRYHGLIIGIKANLPVVSLDLKKGDDLLSMIGLPICDGQTLSQKLVYESQDVGRSRKLLDWHGELFHTNLRQWLRFQNSDY